LFGRQLELYAQSDQAPLSAVVPVALDLVPLLVRYRKRLRSCGGQGDDTALQLGLWASAPMANDEEAHDRDEGGQVSRANQPTRGSRC
jgi:hypothetical protein